MAPVILRSLKRRNILILNLRRWTRYKNNKQKNSEVLPMLEQYCKESRIVQENSPNSEFFGISETSLEL